MNRLTVADAARRLGRNPELVRRWLREGRLRGESFGGVWMISERELERFRKSEPERRPRVRWVTQRPQRVFHATTFGDNGRPSLTMFCGARVDPKRSRTWELSSEVPDHACTRCLSIIEQGGP